MNRLKKSTAGRTGFISNIKVAYIVFVSLLFRPATVAGQMHEHTIKVQNLRCEYLIDPLGVDVVSPRLSWNLESSIRGQQQMAYQILVATSPELLTPDKSDLWSSGKIMSDRSIQIEYEGKMLVSRQKCYWKVKVWDKNKKPSDWSSIATWSMGLLKQEDWTAKWIAHREPIGQQPVIQHFGYQSWYSKSADSAKWVSIDLGKDMIIDSIKIFPVLTPDVKAGFKLYGLSPDKDGFLFPVRFRLEVADKPDFCDAICVADKSNVDFPNPGKNAANFPLKPTRGRYVRLWVNRLAARDASYFGFAIAELMVFQKAENISFRTEIKALDSVMGGGWSPSRLVDGRIEGEKGQADILDKPATMVRKEFDITKPVRNAIISITGLGLYELSLNGSKVGSHILAPEWTKYSKRIQYQTFDVTDLLKQGKNAIGAVMAGGWWTGPMAIESPVINPRFCLLAQLDIDFADGTSLTVNSDETWKSFTDGPIQRAGIYFGETYDATKETPGWDAPMFVDVNWKQAQVIEYPDNSKNALLVAQPNEPIKVVTELAPISIAEPEKGVFVFDMGQNMVGWCRLKANEPARSKITIRYAEVLNEDGTIYTANLRGANQINEYIWKGGETEIEPHFTYHGFRYVEVTGLTKRPDKSTITGRVFYSAAGNAGNFSCSNELVNKIMQSVLWVQRGNMQSVPTDCPQRSERFGWLGDFQSFSQTAIFNMDMAAFLTKWFADIRDSQLEDGRYPNLAPHPADFEWMKWWNAEFAPGWSDAGVIIPWRAYENYADKRILSVQYESAKRWLAFVHQRNPDLIWRNERGGDYGDWLNGSMTSFKDLPREASILPNEVFATAFFAHSVELVYKMAVILNHNGDAKYFKRLFEDIKKAFNREFVLIDGRIKGDSQAGYTLALNFNLLSPENVTKAVEHLLQAIKKYNGYLSTGIHATHRMLLELSRHGHHEEAWRLVNLRTPPSWGYMIDMGATTIWERWDGYQTGNGFQSPNMNSFNHMAFGSVGEWVWRTLVGINTNEENPGYKHFFLKPLVSEGISWANGSYNSIHGLIKCNWKVEGNQFFLDITAPVNTTSTVYLPAKDIESVTENGKAFSGSPNIKFIRMENGTAVLKVESGTYSFKSIIK